MMTRPQIAPAVLILVAFLAAESIAAQPRVLNPLAADQQQTFYHLPEGGAVMPLAWYRSLEVIDSTTGQATGQTFADRMGTYGFLTNPNNELPVGFGVVTLDFLRGLPGLSMNCAACHVGELHYSSVRGPVRLRVNGGPNLADVRRFSQDVYQSSLQMLGTPGRLLQFLVRSDRLQPQTVSLLQNLPLESEPLCHATESADALIREVSEILQDARETSVDIESVGRTFRKTPPLSQWEAGISDILSNLQLLVAEVRYFSAQGRFPLSTNEGHGRLDAFATVRFLLFPDESADFPFTAPVSVPHLWGTGQKKWLHWNSNTNSTLQRNMSQALGVGAVQSPGGVHNILVSNLGTLESIVHRISSPAWPTDVFGRLDASRLRRGKVLYQAQCAVCHDAGVVDPRSGLVEFPLYSLSEVGTDPNDALNFHRPVGSLPFSEALHQRIQGLETWYFYKRDPLQSVPLLQQIQWSGGPSRLPAVWRDPLQADTNAPVYAALPLTGVWATAPYLHNNSVPTLRDLLKPAAERPQHFMVGHRDYDPSNVGYTQTIAPSEIPPVFRFDTHDDGNSNAGHDGPLFGADNLTPDETDALLEFLKSL
jgi:hypothetical protein